MLTLQNFELIGSVSVSLMFREGKSYRDSATPLKQPLTEEQLLQIEEAIVFWLGLNT